MQFAEDLKNTLSFIMACYVDQDCQSNQRCIDNVCQCKDSKADPEKNCRRCINGFRITDQGCQPKQCSKHMELCSKVGVCVSNGADYHCVCDELFTGKYCQKCANGQTKTIEGKCIPDECLDTNGKQCTKFGECDIPNRRCVCQPGYAGPLCETCQQGYQPYYNISEIICVANSCFAPDQLSPCSDNGTCITEGGKSFCECYNNTVGEFCEHCAKEHKLLDSRCVHWSCETDYQECAGHGKCILIADVFQCECYGYFNKSAHCSSCIPGFQLIMGRCVADNCIRNGVECSSHGKCDDFSCVCEIGSAGEFCENCDFLGGFDRVDGKICTRPECSIDFTKCHNNGDCEEGVNGWGCECNTGSSGKMCEMCEKGYDIIVGRPAENYRCVPENCISEYSECSGNGYCASMQTEFSCICNRNFDVSTKCRDCMEGFHLMDTYCIESLNQSQVKPVIILLPVLIAIIFIVIIVWFVVKQMKANFIASLQSSTEDSKLETEKLI